MGRSITAGNFCFNTQPPKGGWLFKLFIRNITDSFNTQPPKGGWRRFEMGAF